MTDTEPMRFTGFLIRRAQQAHAAAWSKHVSRSVTSVQYGVLAFLERLPGASQRELCDELDLDRSTIATLVARLELRRLVRRSRDGEDRRRNRLELSESGRAELLRLRPRAEEVEHVLVHDLSDGQRAELRRLLQLMLDSTASDRIVATQ
jgi:DNA-binding MarR family transcriptional regulator